MTAPARVLILSAHLPFKDLREENRLLNRQLKRQTLELERLSGANAELPTVLRAHNEEVRAIKNKVKKVRRRHDQLSTVELWKVGDRQQKGRYGRGVFSYWALD